MPGLGHDAGNDATTPDAAPGKGPGAPDGGIDSSPDAASDCAAIIARLLSTPIEPPAHWAGLDLSNGGKADDSVDGGGLTIDEADILKCATSVEPDVLEAGAVPLQPGARTATFTSATGASVSIAYNLESRVIWLVKTNAPASSTLSFHARAGGKYAAGNPDGGVSTYEIGFGPDGDAGPGYVKKNGKDFPADFTVTADDAGIGHASAWTNEIYDGMMATYAPSVPAVGECLDVSDPRAVVPASESACIVNGYLLSIRPLGTYFGFNYGTNQTQYMYRFWKGGWPSCATPRAAVDQLENSPIYVTGNANLALGPAWGGNEHWRPHCERPHRKPRRAPRHGSKPARGLRRHVRRRARPWVRCRNVGIGRRRDRVQARLGRRLQDHRERGVYRGARSGEGRGRWRNERVRRQSRRLLGEHAERPASPRAQQASWNVDERAAQPREAPRGQVRRGPADEAAHQVVRE